MCTIGHLCMALDCNWQKSLLVEIYLRARRRRITESLSVMVLGPYGGPQIYYPRDNDHESTHTADQKNIIKKKKLKNEPGSPRWQLYPWMDLFLRQKSPINGGEFLYFSMFHKIILEWGDISPGKSSNLIMSSTAEREVGNGTGTVSQCCIGRCPLVLF